MASSAQGQPDIRIVVEFALREALGMAVEDSTGPWELLWDLLQRFPDANRQFLELVSQMVLFGLALDEQICVVRWHPVTDTEDVLTSSLAFSALREPETWDADRSGNESHLRFYATPAGRETYFTRTVHA